MEMVKGFILLFFCCGLLSFIEARPQKDPGKKKTKWWKESWSKWFPEEEAPKVSDNHVGGSSYKLDSADSKSKSAGADQPKDIVKPPVEVESAKPPGQYAQHNLYNPSEENRWNDKYDGDYNKFVDDEEDSKDYDDIEDQEEEEDEEEDGLESDYSDESKEETDLDSDEDSEEKDFKEIDEELEDQKAKDAENSVGADVEDKKTNNYHGFGFDTAIMSSEKTADERVLESEGQGSKGTLFDTFPDHPDRTHSVKKDLENPANPAYPKDYAQTKPDLKTSPNPPPLGLGDSKLTMVTPSGKKIVKEQKTEKVYIESKPHATCKVDSDCRIGRRCHDGVCVCLAADGCEGHMKPVCGSDLNWYPSHCELHRMACVRGEHIKIDHLGLCFKTKDQAADQEDLNNDDTEPVLDKSEIDIDQEIPKEAIKSPIINSAEIYDYPKGSPKWKAEPEMKQNAPSKVPDKQTEGGKDAVVKAKKCTWPEYEKFKVNLLRFHCSRLAESNCETEVQKDVEYLATLMFSYYDRNLDFYLEAGEADEIEERENYSRFAGACRLADMIIYSDNNPVDGVLSVSEFIAAFNISKRVQQVIPTLATVGNGLELKCSITGSGEIIWRRYHTDVRELHSEDLTVFDDGSLFFARVGVDHMGNFSCENSNNPLVQQIHSLRVQMAPIVRVSPGTQTRRTEMDITVKCHAEGVPKPTIMWQINEKPLPDAPQHFVKAHANGTLTVHKADYLRDTGAYKCLAENQVGKAHDVASIFIQNPNKTSSYSAQPSVGGFIVFHSKGYTAYKPISCLVRRIVQGDFGNFKFIPDNIDAPLRLCDAKAGCSWGTAVNVRSGFVYVSQPDQNRVIVIETAKNWNPIQVIDTDKAPMALHYVEHLDQVWVLCWNGNKDTSYKSIVVIRDASKYIQHHSVHTQPVGNRFDLVRDLFLPSGNDLHHAFNYGYITHNGEQGLFKVDLKKMKYEKEIDFSVFNCIPKTVAFVPIGGHVIVECVSGNKTIQLRMDYITDNIVSHTMTPGHPYVSPDSRHVITVENFHGKVSVLAVKDDGTLESAFEVTLSSPISDVTFFTSHARLGYDAVLTSADSEDIFFLDLGSGKLEKIKGTTLEDGSSAWAPQPLKKTIIPGSVFSNYLLTSLQSSVRIIDGAHHQIQCDFTGPVNTHVIVFVED